MLKKLKKRLKDQHGLTLIELLAVIVILGIIAAIAVPSIGGIINKTKKDAQVAEAIQIVNSAKMYVTAHPNSTSLTTTQLGDYLESIDDTNYTVTIVTATNGSKTYSIKGHEGGKVAATAAGTANVSDDTDVTEATLLNYSK